jgi:Xaa-Pro aminopeptidase
LALLGSVNPSQHGLRIHDKPGDPFASNLVNTIAGMRRRKDADEIAVIRECVRACEAGHEWARINVASGMTELDVYSGVNAACMKAAGKQVVVYGDFLVSTGPSRRAGPPTERVIEAGDMFILDYSVIIDGYRCDFTNTLVVDKKPASDQERLFDLCMLAMEAGEKELCAGKACLTVYEAVRRVFDKEGMAGYFPHHAGHGLGLGHPEPPYIVRNANESLLAGDVVTLEPGLYIDGIGGIRIEHNYLITDRGYERLSNHTISLN